MNRAYPLAFLIPCLLIAGCIPYPHRQHRHPQIAGVVRRSGHPWANATVTLSTESSDNKSIPLQTTQTGPNGIFEFSPQSETKLFMTSGDRRDSWQICFSDKGAEQGCWKGQGYWGGPAHQSLECEISDESDLRCQAH